MPDMYRSNPTLKLAVHENLSIFNKTKSCSSDDIWYVFVTKACSDDNRYSFWSAVKNIVMELPIIKRARIASANIASAKY